MKITQKTEILVLVFFVIILVVNGFYDWNSPKSLWWDWPKQLLLWLKDFLLWSVVFFCALFGLYEVADKINEITR